MLQLVTISLPISYGSLTLLTYSAVLYCYLRIEGIQYITERWKEGFAAISKERSSREQPWDKEMLTSRIQREALEHLITRLTESSGVPLHALRVLPFFPVGLALQLRESGNGG